jgi:ubiquinol-cytochrome c reductase cytochrome c1 subunit
MKPALTGRVRPSVRLQLRGWLAVLLAGAAIVAGAPALAEARLDTWPRALLGDQAAIARGAATFAFRCLPCHAASQVRWRRLAEVGMNETAIAAIMTPGARPTSTLDAAMSARDAKAWFGKVPPDLSVIVRARSTGEHDGRDYLYTLLRGFYRDQASPTGWNNLVYPNIAMPHVLWSEQGSRSLRVVRVVPAGQGGAFEQITQEFGVHGELQQTRGPAKAAAEAHFEFTPADPEQARRFDAEVADLVAWLDWLSEPSASVRRHLAPWVMAYLVVFLLVAGWYNRVLWRDVR